MNTTIHFKDLFPKKWFDSNGKVEAYVSVYHCLTDLLKRTKSAYQVGQIFESVFLLINTRVEFQQTNFNFLGIQEGQPKFDFAVNNAKTNEGCFIYFFIKSSKATEHLVVSKLQTILGLLSNVEGKNTNYWHLTNYVYKYPELTNTTISPVIKLPELEIPFKSGIKVSSFSTEIEKLEETICNRLKLSLRWIFSAENETECIDEFLKIWFAIETIAMPNTTNIRPVIEILSLIYNINIDDVQNKFHIGQIFGLRSNIVHNGQNPIIHSQLCIYLKALYNDLLCHMCKLSPEKRAEKIINDTSYNVSSWLP